MRKIILILAITLTGYSSSGQNTFPTNGNVGIGTTSPASLLSVGSASQFQVNTSGAIVAATGITSSGKLQITGSGNNFTNNFSLTGTGANTFNIYPFANGNTYLQHNGDVIFSPVGQTNPAELVITSTGNIGIGITNPKGKLSIGGSKTAAAWGTHGVNFQTLSATYIDSTTANSGTVFTTAINSFANSNIQTTNSGIVYTNAATLFIGGPPISSNVTITNPYSLYVGAGNSFFSGDIIGNGNLSFRTISDNKGLYGYSSAGNQIMSITRQSVPVSASVAINAYGGFGVATGNTSETPSTSYAFTINPAGNVGIGITNPDQKLSVNGTVHAKGVLIDLNGWPDYVFNSAYKLPKLSEVKTYIDQYKHLPDMPSYQEIEKTGMDVAEINKLLTRKIEELTLYMIEQHKQISEQQTQIDQLKQGQQRKGGQQEMRIAALEATLIKLARSK